MTPSDYAMALGAGVLTGFVCAVPVGPINVAIMEEGIHSGRTRALIIAVGALLMEMIYCVIAFGGFANLFDNPTVRATAELVSFLAVTFFGVRYLMTDAVTVQGKRARMIEQRLHPHTMFWTGFVRVLVNPNVLLFWIMISAVLLANGTLQPAWQSRMSCAVGAGLGIAIWFLILVFGSVRVRNRFSDKTLVRFSQVSGFLLLILSVVIAVRLIATIAQDGVGS
ncbi:MAG: LysE family transporter [Verrucomicrobiota bacterium]|nr:LysE family transporter [Verrucomicrobiota bacterium]